MSFRVMFWRMVDGIWKRPTNSTRPPEPPPVDPVSTTARFDQSTFDSNNARFG